MTSLLDTNVISQRIKPIPNEKVMRWLIDVAHEDTFLSVVTVQELRTGIEMLPTGRKRLDLDSWLVNDIRGSFVGQILPITEEIADLSGRLIARRQKEGATSEINDILLAATASVHGMAVATLNRRHFERLGVELVEF